ncbi:MAG: hypothetical protein KDD60_02810, partial [Bdellovibrionales bacterium]|nr:hypothetical protein [Bdellovibrionales bacterium]
MAEFQHKLKHRKWGLSDVATEEISTIIESEFVAVLEQNREFLVQMLVAKMGGVKVSDDPLELGNPLGVEAEGWMTIASLSQLRKEVGGRFQNLRERWLNAGFPLKAHRGDPSERYELDKAGWLEMSSWLVKQGFECRLLEDLALGYFQ